jgi:hypothetical protein
MVTELAEGMLEPGLHHITWDADSRPSGVYFVNFSIGADNISKTILYVK